ncbi:POP1-domain-containing protein [Ramicandelaber brevisporus]|nr:POP1-domain-containing protein [Ramicandelaber brevisporus]
MQPTAVEGAGGAPRSLMPLEYAASRAFEIAVMRDTMRKPWHSNSARAFQTLPRHLRRRAASHNVKRIPVRLRERALAEMRKSAGITSSSQNTPDAEGSGKKITNAPKRLGKREARRKQKRSGGSRWMETHIWHTKRMHMVRGGVWGTNFVLANYPNEKGHRALHRAATHKCTVHDYSYNEAIEISGPRSVIIGLLRSIAVMNDSDCGDGNWTGGNGSRIVHVDFYRPNCYPMGYIGPAILMWRPLAQSQSSAESRQVLVWVHAAAYTDVLNALTASQAAIANESLRVTDMRGQFAHFELTGPHSLAILRCVMRPANSASNDINVTETVWRLISRLRTAGSLPAGSMLALDAEDPRLTFPQLVNSDLLSSQGLTTDIIEPVDETSSPSDEQALHQLMVKWPKGLATSSIWDNSARSNLLQQWPTEESLNKRRSQQLIPGTKLMRNPEIDPAVPVLMYQRGNAYSPSTSNTSSSTPASASSMESEQGWSVIVPGGVALAFWKSFIFAGARPAGLRDRHNAHFESGSKPYFPDDVPGTTAFAGVSAIKETEAHATWTRKPPAKRPNYIKLKTQHPFSVEFSRLLQSETATSNTESNTDTFAPVNASDRVAEHSNMWMLTSHHVVDILRRAISSGTTTIDAQAVMDALAAHAAKIQQRMSSTVQMNVSTSFVKVVLTFTHRGCPVDNAAICAPTASALSYIMRSSKTRRNNQHQNHSADLNGQPSSSEDPALDYIPSATDVIGSVTTGRYSYSLGAGRAFGAVSVAGLLRAAQLRQQVSSSSKSHQSLYVLVRNPNCTFCSPAILTLLS